MKKFMDKSNIRILWSKSSTDKLMELINNRTPITKISKTLKRSQKSIRRKCDRLKISSSTTYIKNNTDKDK
jgi:hypothetical protein